MNPPVGRRVRRLGDVDRQVDPWTEQAAVAILNDLLTNAK
jgi:hypothetical protein